MRLATLVHRQAHHRQERSDPPSHWFSLGEIINFAAAIIVHLVYVFYVLWRMSAR